jgi:hypothetical protein
MRKIIIWCVLEGIKSINEFKHFLKLKWGLRNLVKNS